MTYSAENDAYCLVCGLRLSISSEWCFDTRDGDHRPSRGRVYSSAKTEGDR